MIDTTAWVLHEGPAEDPSQIGRRGEIRSQGQFGELVLEKLALDEVADHEALVEPIYGAWEGNMGHAIDRSPVDVCRQRKESRVVLGNGGVVRVLRTGSAVRHVKEGDVCLFAGVALSDEFGYMKLAHGYDAPNTVGLLAKATKLPGVTLFKIPDRSRLSLRQWAAFSLRYTTAWSNWRVALGALRLQLGEEELPAPHVWGWGGGTTLAELKLAHLQRCATTMVSGSSPHLEEIRRAGITALNRRELGIVEFDERRYAKDDEFRQLYMAGEKRFLEQVKSITGRGVSIFVDYIGSPVNRMTMKALARQGVLATAGWKLGLVTPVNRATECISRHIHVFTHYIRASEVAPAMAFAEEHGWGPDDGMPVYTWEDVPKLVQDFRNNEVPSYYPLYQVTPV